MFSHKRAVIQVVSLFVAIGGCFLIAMGLCSLLNNDHPYLAGLFFICIFITPVYLMAGYDL